MPIQVREQRARDDLHRAEIGNKPEWQPEPLGGMGVYNGQFDWWKDGVPVGWELYYADANATITQQTDAAAGYYCIRAANSAANARGGYILQRAYMAVNEDRTYSLWGSFRGSLAGCTFILGCYCYDDDKAYLGTADIIGYGAWRGLGQL